MDGSQLKSLRLSVQLSQRSMARLVGVTAPAVSQWENGLTQPTEEHLQAIRDAVEEHRKMLNRLFRTLRTERKYFENLKI
jgi:transcriptional regulator with XRE-family HTH domain